MNDLKAYVPHFARRRLAEFEKTRALAGLSNRQELTTDQVEASLRMAQDKFTQIAAKDEGQSDLWKGQRGEVREKAEGIKGDLQASFRGSVTKGVLRQYNSMLYSLPFMLQQFEQISYAPDSIDVFSSTARGFAPRADSAYVTLTHLDVANHTGYVLSNER